MSEDTTTQTVSANPALVEFPRDLWGMTAELRKAGLRAAGSVRGNPEKQALFVATLRVLAQHSAARVRADADALIERGEKIAAREASAFQRVASRGVPTPETAAEPADAAAE
ncbi:hypothetical protein ACWX0O_01700 [Nitrobacteraceae bacterium UC4449_H16]